MSDYTPVFEMSMPIRWGDMDAFGHVNNTVYFRYMEEARVTWFGKLGIGGGNGEGQGPVVVNASMEFLRQLHYPGDVIARLSAAKPGRSSFDTAFELNPLGRPRARVRAGRRALRVGRLRARQVGAAAGPASEHDRKRAAGESRLSGAARGPALPASLTLIRGASRT